MHPSSLAPRLGGHGRSKTQQLPLTVTWWLPQLVAGVAAGTLACSRPPRPVLAGTVPLDARVRVIARDLSPSWHPARLIRSDEGCRIVTVATTRQEGPIVVRNMGQIRRLQLSQAVPPPDWWTEPHEEEGWTEIDPEWLRNESNRCRSRYPSEPTP